MASTATAEKLETPQYDLIIVDSSPAEISVNFEVVCEALETALEKYDVVITADTLPDGRKLATELNRMAADYDRMRKEAIEKVSGPIRTFDEQMKSIVKMCKDGRLKLTNQIATFEQKVLDDAKADMKALLVAEWDAKNVEPQYRKATIDDLVKKGAITGKGNLTTAAKASVRSRAQDDKSLQDLINMRLVMLENQSYKAGLSAPLTRAHVESFLFEGETIYQNKLDAMMESEKQRQAVTETAMRERIANEQAQPKEVIQEAQALPEPEPLEVAAPAPTNVVHMAAKKVDVTPDAGAEPNVDYAYGPLEAISKAKFETTTRSQIEAMAIAENPTGNIGIWTKEGLITQILRDASVTN